VVLLAGGVLAVSIAGVGLYLVVFCATALGGACLGLSLLIALPAITGCTAIVAAVVVFVRPALHRVGGAAALALSAITIAVGVVLFAPFPAALVFVLVLFAWPVLITFIGGVLALLWKPIPNVPSWGPPIR
jgi:hypothetical protein